MTRAFIFCLLTLFLGALCGVPPAPPGMTLEMLDAMLDESEPPRRTRAAGVEWLQLLEEYARTQMMSSEQRVLKAFRLELPLSDREETVSVLVLPVPIFRESCNKDIGRGHQQSEVQKPSHIQEAPPAPTLNNFVGRTPAQPSPFRLLDNHLGDQNYLPPAAFTPQPFTLSQEIGYPDAPSLGYVYTPPNNPLLYFNDERNNAVGQDHDLVKPNYLVEQFRLQRASDVELPPALLPHSQVWALSSPQFGQVAHGPAPPQPRWARSLTVTGELTVPRAGYSEPYIVRWDAATRASAVVMHGGSSSAHVQPLADGTYRLASRIDDNSEGSLVRRCFTSEPHHLSVQDQLSVPTLPNPDPFGFAGYTDVSGEQAEVWRHSVQDVVHGEVLTYHHELLVRRTSHGEAHPISYKVSVDSSILGHECDGWQHRYIDVREQEHSFHDLVPNEDHMSCDKTEILDPLDLEHRAILQPLREFTLPTQDPKYEITFQRFMSDYQRVYKDENEEAVRKNLLIQHSRFIASCNRQGGPFEVSVNFLGDRLDAELNVLLGVEDSSDEIPAESFPYSATEVNGITDQLPEEFDWRNEGAVSHVRYQGSCSSCWAVAVGGAVEGALWRRTRRLIPLAEQCLVDCAHQYGANGCRGTWPSHAYEYVRNKGLPALDEYGAHKEKVETGRDKEVPPITHISAHVNVTMNNWPALKVAIKELCPTVVIIDAKAKSFVFYKKGILYDDRCGKQRPRLNHAVLAVGYGPEYAILKNSWSAAWGESGYVRVQAPSNTCGVLAQPSYPRLEEKDVDRP